MSEIEEVSYWCGGRLPPTSGPAADLVVLDTEGLPPLASLAAWVMEARTPTIVAARALEQGARMAYFFDETGTVVGRQLQLHRMPGDDTPDRLGDDLQVMNVGGHRVAALLAGDVVVPELGRILALSGVDLVLGLALPMLPAYLGLWSQVQQNQFIGLAGTAPAPSVYLPCEATPDGSGTLEWSHRHGWWVKTLDWGVLQAVRGDTPLLAALNPDVYLTHPWWYRKASDADAI